MLTWEQFIESKNTSKIDAVMDLAKSIRDVAKDYTLTTRKEAWKKIISKKGESLVQDLLKTPTRNLSSFRTLVP